MNYLVTLMRWSIIIKFHLSDDDNHAIKYMDNDSMTILMTEYDIHQ